MANKEVSGHLKYKDEDGNISILYPITKKENVVGLENVPNVSTNDQTPTYNEAAELATLTSGEKLSVAFGKIAKAISSLISHLANKSNPHGVTASQVGAVPTTRKINNKELSADISLTASDVGAAESSHNQAASTVTAGTFAGQVVANSAGQTPATSLLRNSTLVPVETAPTVSGEICWTFK